MIKFIIRKNKKESSILLHFFSASNFGTLIKIRCKFQLQELPTHNWIFSF